jgi:hypothetical protein
VAAAARKRATRASWNFRASAMSSGVDEGSLAETAVLGAGFSLGAGVVMTRFVVGLILTRRLIGDRDLDLDLDSALYGVPDRYGVRSRSRMGERPRLGPRPRIASASEMGLV